ncbi:MAG: type II toxin-antitoxin system VapC family toxin [Armatimonadetes bacterium]|nr:type II toxin-antitoxin system VapC family toxin [Armatimonadota bacterium]
MYFIDVNVLMYAAGADHPYRLPCQAILRGLIDGKIEGCTDVEVFQEILRRYFAIGRRAEAIQLLRDVPAVLPSILSIRREELLVIPDLATRYPHLTARDLIHLAVMLNVGLSEILTADRDFDGVAEVRRVDPLVLAGSL